MSETQLSQPVVVVTPPESNGSAVTAEPMTDEDNSMLKAPGAAASKKKSKKQPAAAAPKKTPRGKGRKVKAPSAAKRHAPRTGRKAVGPLGSAAAGLLTTRLQRLALAVWIDGVTPAAWDVLRNATTLNLANYVQAGLIASLAARKHTLDSSHLARGGRQRGIKRVRGVYAGRRRSKRINKDETATAAAATDKTAAATASSSDDAPTQSDR
jgi:hypothetical protein